MYHLIGHSRNALAIYVDLIHSEAAQNISRQPHLLTLLTEALPKIRFDPSKDIIEHDMGRVIGYDHIAKAVPAESVFYAKLIKASAYTRFVKNIKPLPSSHITLHLRRLEDGRYVLHNVWIGHHVPPLPGSESEDEFSRPYWSEHALIFDNQPVQTSTLTKKCPY